MVGKLLTMGEEPKKNIVCIEIHIPSILLKLTASSIETHMEQPF